MGGLIACFRRAAGQQPLKIPRVGVLWFASSADPVTGLSNARFYQRLAELGYVQGKTITVDIRYAERDLQRLDELARDFVARGVDIIVTPAVAASVAARKATTTIPIVMVYAGNPEGAGLIGSLARPGGNVTGTSNISLGGKQVEMIRELIPRLGKIAILYNPTNAGAAPTLAELTTVARSFNIGVVGAEVTRIEVVRPGLSRPLRHGRRVRRQDSQGRQTGRPSGPAAAQVRAANQRQDREGARVDHPAVAVAACG
jgi:putative ABC transport system substrate-binding protein